MTKDFFLKQTKGGIIVSCQALSDEPLYGSQIMARMAVAAQMGGAVAIRCGLAQDIEAIRKAVTLPVIGLIKQKYDGYPVYITPTLEEVRKIYEAGAHIVALDATDRKRPQGLSAQELIQKVKALYGEKLFIMADISTYEEGAAAALAGADMLSTTLSGYTPYSPQQEEPDFKLMERLSHSLSIPVMGEGRIWTPEEAKHALQLGVHAVIIGTAITRPREITARFVNKTQDHPASVRREEEFNENTSS